MSAKHVAWVRRHSLTVGTDRQVLLILAEYANKNDRCWPRLDGIATAAGISKAAASRAIKRLVRLGAIAIEQEPDRQVYRLNLNTEAAAA